MIQLANWSTLLLLPHRTAGLPLPLISLSLLHSMSLSELADVRPPSRCPSVEISSERGERGWRTGLNLSFSYTDQYEINVNRLETSLW